MDAFLVCPSIGPVLFLKEYSDRIVLLHCTVANLMLITPWKSYKSVFSQSLAQWMTIILTAAWLMGFLGV